MVFDPTDYDPFSVFPDVQSGQRKRKQVNPNDFTLGEIGITASQFPQQEMARHGIDLQPPRIDPVLPEATDYDPFAAFKQSRTAVNQPDPSILFPRSRGKGQTSADPNLGVLGESFGIYSPQDQQNWLKAERQAAQGLITGAQDRLRNRRAMGMSPEDDLLGADEARQATAAIKQGQTRLKELAAMERGELALPVKSGLRSAVENFPRAVAETVISVPEMAGIIKGYIQDGPVDDEFLLNWSQGAKEWVARQFPGDPARQNEFTQQLATGAGSLVSFYGVGILARLAKLSRAAQIGVIAGFGGAASGTQGFEEATQELLQARAAAAASGDQPAVDDYDRLLKTIGYSAVGLTEAAPIARTLTRAVPEARTRLGQRLIQGAEGAAEEAVQESGAQLAQNIISQHTTDPERAAMEGVGDAAAVGGTLGGLINFLMPGRFRPGQGGDQGGQTGYPQLPPPENWDWLNDGGVEDRGPLTPLQDLPIGEEPGVAPLMLPDRNAPERNALKAEMSRLLRANPAASGQMAQFMEAVDQPGPTQDVVQAALQKVRDTGKLSAVANELIQTMRPAIAQVPAPQVSPDMEVRDQFAAPGTAGRVQTSPLQEQTQTQTQTQTLEREPLTLPSVPLSDSDILPAIGSGVPSRDIDNLGFYSQALESARTLPQATGTPEQMLAQLEKGGTKEAEVRATDLDKFLFGETLAQQRRQLVDLRTEANALRSEMGQKDPEITPARRAEIEAELARIQPLLATGEEELRQGLQSANLPRRIARDDLVGYLDQNRVRLQQSRYGGSKGRIGVIPHMPGEPVQYADRETGDIYTVEFSGITGPDGQQVPIGDEPPDQAIMNYIRNRGVSPNEVTGPAKWETYSLDPGNPTYRETPVSLNPEGPAVRAYLQAEREMNEKYGGSNRWMTDLSPEDKAYMEELNNAVVEEQSAFNRNAFTTGHWDEPNVIAHYRTQQLQTADGRTVLNGDEFQSDWGQKIREGGARDEAKIAELTEKHREAMQQLQSLLVPTKEHLKNLDYFGFDTWAEVSREIRSNPNWRQAYDVTDAEAAPIQAYLDAVEREKILDAELRTAKAATPAHPLVRSTDQWLTTTLRKFIKDAVDAGVDGVTITPGQMQIDRYPSLSTVADEFVVVPSSLGNDQRSVFVKKDGDTRTNFGIDHTGTIIAGQSNWLGQDLSSVVGADYAQKIMSAPMDAQMTSIPVEEGQIGGEGMRATYDKIYPRALAKILYKYDKSIKPERVKLLPHKIAQQTDMLQRMQAEGKTFDDYPYSLMSDKDAEVVKQDFTFFPITDKVRQKIREEGQPLFALGGGPNVPTYALESNPQAAIDALRIGGAILQDWLGNFAQVSPEGAWPGPDAALAAVSAITQSGQRTMEALRRAMVDAGFLEPIPDEILSQGLLAANFLMAPETKEGIDPLFAITAFNGSPHDFDRFDMSKIGTGEGAQAFGRGLYFAENESVGRHYQVALSGGRSGYLYEVEIDVEPEQLLDWDKPLSQQSDEVIRALSKIDDFEGAIRREYSVKKRDGEWFIKDVNREYYIGPYDSRKQAQKALDEKIVDDAWYTVRDRLQYQDHVEVFRDAGIPGIRYLDQGSRDANHPRAASGTRNIVIFDDSLVKITKKNGKPVTAEERQQVIDPLYAIASFPLSGNQGRMTVLQRQQSDLFNQIDTLRGEIQDLIGGRANDLTPQEEAAYNALAAQVDSLNERLPEIEQELNDLYDKQHDAKAQSGLFEKRSDLMDRAREARYEKSVLETEVDNLTRFAPVNDFQTRRQLQIARKRLADVTARETEVQAELDKIQDDLSNLVFALRGFYSPAIRAVEKAKQDKATPEQWKKVLTGPGVRQEEVRWMGVMDWLDEQASMMVDRPGSNQPKSEKTITKSDLIDFLRAHQYELEQRILLSERDPDDIPEDERVDEDDEPDDVMSEEERDEWITERADELRYELEREAIDQHMRDWSSQNDPDDYNIEFGFEEVDSGDQAHLLEVERVYTQDMEDYRRAMENYETRGEIYGQYPLPGLSHPRPVEPTFATVAERVLPEDVFESWRDGSIGWTVQLTHSYDRGDEDIEDDSGSDIFPTREAARAAAEARLSEIHRGFEAEEQQEQFDYTDGNDFAYEYDQAYQQAREDFEHEYGGNIRRSGSDYFSNQTRYKNYAIKGGRHYQEMLVRLPMLEGKYSSHHYQDQEVVHIRYDVRTGPNGEKVLFIHEIQSDLHQRARGFGFGAQGLARAKQAHEENGWTPELRQAQNDIDGRVQELQIEAARMVNERIPQTDAVFQTVMKELEAAQKQSSEIAERATASRQAAASYISTFTRFDGAPEAPYTGTAWWELGFKAALQRAVEKGFDGVALTTPAQIREATYTPEKVAQKFYGENVPKFINKYVKQWGSKPEQKKLSGTKGGKAPEGNPYWPITDAMRKDLSGEGTGQPLAIGTDQILRGIDTLLAAGRSVTIGENVRDAIFNAIEPHRAIVPSGLNVGHLSRIEPVKGNRRRVNAYFTTEDGSSHVMEYDRDGLLGLRAFFQPPNGALPPGIFFLRTTTQGEFQRGVIGEIRHEAIHALRRGGRLPDHVWSTLVGHARKLQVMDISFADYLDAIGRPTQDIRAHAVSIGDQYRSFYSGRSDFQEVFEQEAVAHLSELYSHDAWTQEEIAPVKAILDDIFAGRYSGASPNPRGGGTDPSFALSPVNRQGQPIKDDPKFKRWFKQSAVQEDGDPKIVYHATLADIPAFDPRRPSIESNLGKGFYFTDSTEDSSANYGRAIGPDIMGRITHLAERLNSDAGLEYNDPHGFDKAREQLGYVHEGVNMPVYLSMQKPVVLSDPFSGIDSTFFPYESGETYDPETDEYEYGEPSGELAEFFENLRQVAPDYDGINIEPFIADLMEDVFINEGLTADQIYTLASNSENFIYGEDRETGSLSGMEPIRRAYEMMGYDGIIDHTVDEKFSTMEGIQGATHYVVFKPEQIKSVFNAGEFDPGDPDILAAIGSKRDSKLSQQAQSILSSIKNGRAVPIPADLTNAVFDAIKPGQAMVPDGYVVANISKMEPVPSEPDNAYFTFLTDQGKTIRHKLPANILTTGVAFHAVLPGANNRPAVPGIFFIHFTPRASGDQYFRGKIRHESIHALRTQNRIREDIWVRLLDHAKELRVMDHTLGLYFEAIGEAKSSEIQPHHYEKSLGKAYHDLYKDKRMFYQEFMDQEAIAHMAELYEHDVFTPQEIAPVKHILDAMFRGDFSRGTPEQANALEVQEPLPHVPGAVRNLLRKETNAFERTVPAGTRDRQSLSIEAGAGASQEFGQADRITPSREDFARSSLIGESLGRRPIDEPLRHQAVRDYLGNWWKRDAPLKRATLQGFTLPAWHATKSDFLVPDPARPGRDFGFHMAIGTPRAANDRVGFSQETIDDHLFAGKYAPHMLNKIFQAGFWRDRSNVRQLPLLVKVKNPLRVPDLNAWGAMPMWRGAAQDALAGRLPEIDPKSHDFFRALQPKMVDIMTEKAFDPSLDVNQKFQQALVSLLELHGYDALIYKNEYEDKGNDSLMVWDASRVRSTNDAFDPRANGSPGLFASVPFMEADLRQELNQALREEGLDEIIPQFSIGTSLGDQPETNQRPMTELYTDYLKKSQKSGKKPISFKEFSKSGGRITL